MKSCKECGKEGCLLNQTEGYCLDCPECGVNWKEKKMEFQKERVFTAVDADELRAGDKVIVANTMANLREDVRKGINIDMLREVHGEDCLSRFIVKEGWFPLAYLVERAENCTNCGNKYCSTPLAHKETSVCDRYEPKTEQKAEKHTNYNHCEEARKAYACAMTNACPNKQYRPFRDTDELIKVWLDKYNKAYGSEEACEPLFMPHIWVREKGCDKSADLITCFGSKGITVRGEGMYFDTLFEMFEFLDGSPCGVEE